MTDKREFNLILEALRSGNLLSEQQMQAAVGWLLSGQAEAEPVRDFLVLLAERGETVEELTGAARGMRDSMVRVSIPSDERQIRPVTDTCGTGGDGSKTFNISTASAILLAACGVRVAKHGNRKITSSTGSADVLSELGINLDASPQTAAACLRNIGICFCFAPRFHPAMKHIGPIRRSIPHPTIFNRLGPLANPALAELQLLGVGDAALQDKLAAALQRLGTQRSVVVRGEDGVDEVSLSAATRVLEVTPNAITEHTWHPQDFGLPTADRGELFADSPSSSAACIRSVMSGERGPKRDVVVLNTAAGLWIAGKSNDLRQCTELAEQAIDEGRGMQVIKQLAEATTENSS